MNLLSWVTELLFPSSDANSLSRMRLGPAGSENPTMLQFFTWDCKHSSLSWWKHLNIEIPQLAEMGFTQVWLPPPSKAMNKDGRGYDAYDLWDLGEFEQKGCTSTRWGSKDELLAASTTAKSHGVDIILDAVLNHKLGGDRMEKFPAVPVDPNNRLKTIGDVREIEGWTGFDFAGRGGKYSKFRWTQEHFTGLDWDHRTRTKGVFRIEGKGHKGWSSRVDQELGNYDYLLGVDIDHRHAEVQQDFFAWGPWILETVGASGFRFDAIKHIDRRFVLDFIKKCRQSTEQHELFAVSECWFPDFKQMQAYFHALGGLTAFFDVPLHYNFHNASKMGSKYDLRNILDKSIWLNRPGDAVIFVDNHDTVQGATLESWVGSNFKTHAYALILLRGGGHPCVFYGDLYPNKEYDQAVARNLTKLMEARKTFAYGATTDYFADPNCIGFIRAGDEKHRGCAVVMSNRSDHEGSDMSPERIRMHVGRAHADEVYEGLLGSQARIAVDQEGWATFTCLSDHLEVWVPISE